MTEFNWDSFIKELEKFQKGIENIGGHSRETIIEAPAKEEEILEVEKKLGYTLPKDFRDILLNYSSHFEYFWSTYRDEEEEQIEFPEKFCSIFAGDLHWGLKFLLDFEESRQGWVDISYPDYDRRILRSLYLLCKGRRVLQCADGKHRSARHGARATKFRKGSLYVGSDLCLLCRNHPLRGTCKKDSKDAGASLGYVAGSD